MHFSTVAKFNDRRKATTFVFPCIGCLAIAGPLLPVEMVWCMTFLYIRHLVK